MSALDGERALGDKSVANRRDRVLSAGFESILNATHGEERVKDKRRRNKAFGAFDPKNPLGSFASARTDAENDDMALGPKAVPAAPAEDRRGERPYGCLKEPVDDAKSAQRAAPEE